MTGQRTQVALVDDHQLLAESLLLALHAEGFDAATVPVPSGGDMQAVLADLLQREPDVVLLDLDLGDVGDGAPLVSPLAHAGSAVVVITSSREQSRWGECLARGARTVLPKASGLEHVVGIVRRIADGLPVISDDQRNRMIQEWYRWRSASNSVRAGLDRLTRREGQVLAALATGKRVRDIAADAYVSEATVRSQVKSILAKLGVTSQIAAVALARDIGWDPVA